MTTRRKHKRINRDRVDRAWDLVQYWYEHQVRERAVRYSTGGQKLSVAVSDATYGDSLEKAKRERPENWGQVESVTADGRERRYILPQEAARGFWGVATDPGIVGRDQKPLPAPGPRINYVREVMRHVGRLSPDAHRVLEMRAATWDFPAIAEEMNCADPTARQYFSEGIGVVMCFQSLVKPRHE